MSALTKVFVVLHVILSVMLVAGMVTFVNKVENHREARIKAEDQGKVAVAQRDSALADAQLARAERDTAVATANNRAQANEQAFNAQLEQVARLQGEVQSGKLDVQKAQIQVQTALGQAKAAQEALATAETALQQVRKESDDLQRKYSEAMVAISDTTQKLDATGNRYRKIQEDLTAAQATIEDLRKRGAGGLSFEQPGGAPGRPAPAAPGAAAPTPGAGPVAANQNLKGVVRSKRTIQGVEYATISLGSADNVQRGMQFRVIDRQANKFLGFMTVASVDYNEATGPLQGPAVNQIKAGSEVITNWQ